MANVLASKFTEFEFQNFPQFSLRNTQNFWLYFSNFSFEFPRILPSKHYEFQFQYFLEFYNQNLEIQLQNSSENLTTKFPKNSSLELL